VDADEEDGWFLGLVSHFYGAYERGDQQGRCRLTPARPPAHGAAAASKAVSGTPRFRPQTFKCRKSRAAAQYPPPPLSSVIDAWSVCERCLPSSARLRRGGCPDVDLRTPDEGGAISTKGGTMGATLSGGGLPLGQASTQPDHFLDRRSVGLRRASTALARSLVAHAGCSADVGRLHRPTSRRAVADV
jgi:hypothetical protein